MNDGPPHPNPSQRISGDGQPSKPPVERSWHWLTRLNWSREPELDSLNRALVAGLMLEVMLENPRLGEKSGSRRHHLKACLRSVLTTQLAGRIPLASFQNLAHGLDHWFEVYYPVLAEAGFSGHTAGLPRVTPSPGVPLKEDLFAECLERVPGLLPKRRHRKFDQEKLLNFLESTKGRWFRLRDFEDHFQIDRKTAWEYVQKLLQVGLLLHNQGHSSAVRYRVAPQFLQSVWVAPTDHAGQPVPGNPLYPDW